MKIRMLEACDEDNKGSLGCRFVINAATDAGYNIDYIRHDNDDNNEYDIELISVHHSSDFPKVLSIDKKAKVRVIGGHPMQNNPRPLINHADVICVGEAESWIVDALDLLIKSDLDVDSLCDLKGTIISKNWEVGATLPTTIFEKKIPFNAPILSEKTEGHAATWYIEIGRGCPFSCAYCELGHSVKARMQSIENVKKAIDMCDPSISRKLTLFAPDEASHRHYGVLLEYIHKEGFITQFGSMRLDQILRKKNIPFKQNMLIRVGVDGLSETIRERVNKRMTDNTIIEYFYYMFENGHVNFKIFQIFSYSFETDEDFKKWEQLYLAISSYPFKKNVMMRVKFTPFIPQPITPLADEKLTYSNKMRKKIEDWYLKNRFPKTGIKGINLTLDGIMGAKSHKDTYMLTNGDENINIGMYS